jgi:DNA-binding MarR family transcriptional regulator
MAVKKPKKPRRTREELHRDLDMAGRVMSTAAVMFHTKLAELRGLGATESKALDILDRFGPLSAGEFGERTGLAPATITGLLDRLEQKGVARRIKDPKDGRRVLIEIDRSSLAPVMAVFGPFLASLHQVYDRYSLAELEVALRFMREITDVQVKATQQLGAPPAASG